MRKTFSTELGSRLRTRGGEVFTYMLNLAWIMLFRDVFSLLMGPDPPLPLRLFVAVLFSAIAAAVVAVRSGVVDVTEEILAAEEDDA